MQVILRAVGFDLVPLRFISTIEVFDTKNKKPGFLPALETMGQFHYNTREGSKW